MMFYCNDCKESFSEPGTEIVVHTEIDKGPDEIISICPVCGSDDIEKMKKCVCGNDMRSIDDYCEECIILGEEVRTAAIGTLIKSQNISYSEAMELLFYGLED